MPYMAETDKPVKCPVCMVQNVKKDTDSFASGVSQGTSTQIQTTSHQTKSQISPISQYYWSSCLFCVLPQHLCHPQT